MTKKTKPPVYQKDIARQYDKMVGTVIRDKRVSAGLLQEQLGDMVGLSFATISRFESGNMIVKPYALFVLAKALNCTACDLLPEVK